jgi:hypothetical protein
MMQNEASPFCIAIRLQRVAFVESFQRTFYVLCPLVGNQATGCDYIWKFSEK